jgi:hypothetical protein
VRDEIKRVVRSLVQRGEWRGVALHETGAAAPAAQPEEATAA